MPKFYWKDDAACLDYDTNIFFDKYEEDVVLRPAVDKVCLACPVKRECFAAGIGGKEYGVWGGVFLDEGKIFFLGFLRKLLLFNLTLKHIQ